MGSEPIFLKIGVRLVFFFATPRVTRNLTKNTSLTPIFAGYSCRNAEAGRVAAMA